jgi:hypothetical protein
MSGDIHYFRFAIHGTFNTSRCNINCEMILIDNLVG